MATTTLHKVGAPLAFASELNRRCLWPWPKIIVIEKAAGIGFALGPTTGWPETAL